MTDGLCRTFWGSRGCDLAAGHPDSDRHHQCGRDDEEDGPCSVVDRQPDGTWTVRYDTGDGIEYAPSYPVELFGDAE